VVREIKSDLREEYGSSVAQDGGRQSRGVVGKKSKTEVRKERNWQTKKLRSYLLLPRLPPPPRLRFYGDSGEDYSGGIRKRKMN